MKRREVLGAPFLQLGRKAKPPIAGGFVLDAFPLGHRLRDQQGWKPNGAQEKFPIVIVGGGMAGLSAAWWLEKQGMRDFVLLEMEAEAGGNSRFGQNEVSAFPWGAHYLPVPNRNSPLVRELCEELGLLTNGEWNERHLCHTPQERLYRHGRWQFGIEVENDQSRRFDEVVAKLRATGNWTIPHALGRVDEKLTRLPFANWLKENRFDSPDLLWYLDYSMRDDYGANLQSASAWAGLHYFAARDHEEAGPFTWPEGNGWILRQLRHKLRAHLRTNLPVFRVERADRAWRVHSAKGSFLAQRVIWAAPVFLAPYLIEGQSKPQGFTYSPWVVANLTLHRWPHDGNIPFAWDNVIFGSPSLGYVVATHQNLNVHQEKTVWTWYSALAEQEPAAARKLLLEKPWEYWRDLCLADLRRPHPDIEDCVSRIDIFRNGHAMVRPTIAPRMLNAPAGIHFANADLSGLSIFEEAQYRGVEAAKAAYGHLARA
ncbi:MAG: FAD-dependent oxidoreductase [Bryobacter sp.]|nr:FAD-dependent oxidoreductase [Bryobacter sp.]